MKRGKPLVPRGRGTVSVAFDVLQKLPHPIGGNVDHGQAIDRPLCRFPHKRDEQSQRVTIAALGVSGEISFVHEMF
jgi:hypothetical protein